MKMKSIRFPAPIADAMVRAILDGHKTATRRVVRPQLPTSASVLKQHRGRVSDWTFWVDNGVVHTMKMPHRHGDILYVRETWRKWVGGYSYKADAPDWACQWHPSTTMPKEAARLFLRVTDVRVERLQEITTEGILAEGIQSKKPEWFEIDFADLWNSTIKKADLPLYGWAAHPWVWVIGFERISREEAENGIRNQSN